MRKLIVSLLLISSIVFAQYEPPGSGGGSSTIQKAFNMCGNPGCGPANSEVSNWQYNLGQAGTLYSVTIVPGRTASGIISPVGSSVIYDIQVNGTSVFGANPKPTLTVGQTTPTTYTTFATSAILATDLIQAINTQADSAGALGAQFVDLVMTFVLPGGSGPPGLVGQKGDTGLTESNRHDHFQLCLGSVVVNIQPQHRVNRLYLKLYWKSCW
jgi:hypothetical protein